MCGIFSIVNNGFSESVIRKKFINGAGRGPENSVIKRYKNHIFGFHHLAINGYNDKSSLQPLETDDCILICNGEIYNWKQLYLEIGSENKKTNSDCEIIIHLYLKYGFKRMVQMLDGVFAFVLHDKKTERTYVARDLYGVRPLFVSKRKDMVIFSSEMKMMPNNIGLMSIKPGTIWYERECSINLSFSQFSPGMYGVYDSEGNELHNGVFAQPNAITFNNFIDESLYKNMIRDALIKAVEKRVDNTERPIACLLSGGLDSSLISALVAREISMKNGPPVKTFSIGFEGSEDILMAEKVAKYIKSDHTSVIMKEREFLDAIETVIYNIESYDTTTVRASVGNYLISKYIRDNTDCKVIFNGDGSDEVTGGYMYFHYAPDKYSFDKECRRLLENICYYDVLRSDRSISSNGLEARTPFLDRDFVNTYLNVPVEMRYHKQNGQCEKHLLRESMQDLNLLPEEVLWRRKEAFSDGVSGKKSWFEIVQEFVKKNIYPDVKEDEVNDFIEKTVNKNKFFINRPKTLEQLYYRSVFEKYYSNQAHTIPLFWMPRFVVATDASARTLDIYNQTMSDKSSTGNKLLEESV